MSPKKMLSTNLQSFKQSWDKKGYFVVENFFNLNFVQDLKESCLRVAEDNKSHTYTDEEGLIRRVEYFTKRNKTISYADELVKSFLAELFEEEYSLFKDKINYKPAGGEGFFAHYDGIFNFIDFNGIETNGWYKYTNYFVNALIILDDFTLENGALEVSSSHSGDFTALMKNTKQNGTPDLTDEVEKACAFLPVCSPAGSLVVFSNTCPHRSSANRTQSSRGSVYLTYNRSEDGDLYEQYFEDKVGSKNTTSKSLSGEKA